LALLLAQQIALPYLAFARTLPRVPLHPAQLQPGKEESLFEKAFRFSPYEFDKQGKQTENFPRQISTLRLHFRVIEVKAIDVLPSQAAERGCTERLGIEN
jgi:hypothetical protein